MVKMGRAIQDTKTVVIDAGEATSSTSINVAGWTSMVVYVQNGWTASNIGFKASYDNVSFYILRDKASVPIQIATVLATGARAYAVPTEFAGVRFVKLWSKHGTAATETDIAQVTAQTLYIDLTA